MTEIELSIQEELKNMRCDFIKESSTLLMDAKTPEEIRDVLKQVHEHLERCMRRRSELIREGCFDFNGFW